MNSNLTTEHSSFSFDPGGGLSDAGPRIDIKRILRQNIWLILGTGFFLAIPSGIAVWMTTPLEYVAKAQLQFAAATPGVLQENQDSGRNYQSYVATQLAFITGPILREVVNDDEVLDYPEIKESDDPKEFLASKVSTSSERGSELVTITVRMLNRDHAIVILDLMIARYMNQVAAQSFEVDSVRITAIQEEVDKQIRALNIRDDNINLAQEGLGAFRSDATGALVLSDPVQEHLVEAVKDASERLGEKQYVEREQETYRRAMDAFEASPRDPIYLLDIEQRVEADVAVSSLKAELVLLDSKLSRLRRENQPGNNERVLMEEEWESKQGMYEEKKLNMRREKLAEKGAQLEEARLLAENRWKEADTRRNGFAVEIDKREKEREAAAKHANDLERWKDERNDIRYRIKSLNGILDAILLEKKAPARASQVAGGDASASKKPDTGKRLQLLILAIGGSFGMGFALAFLRELTNNHARSASDLAGITPLPLLASIPDTKAERFPEDLHVPLLCADFPHSPTADEYRRVLARLVYPPDDTIEVNSCMITSPTRGDGKTSIACNLAVTLASANRSVILIDICPRNPSVELNFGLEPAEGLAEAIAGDSTVENLARATEFANLRVLGPGAQADFLKGRLASREMMDLLEQLENEYDHVIIDTPPALLMSDAKLLAPVVDAVLVVVGSGVSTLGMIRRCLRELDQENANLIGVIMNRVRPMRGGYMQDNLDLFYHYSDSSAEEAVNREFPDMKLHEDGAEEETVPAFALLPDEEDRDDR